MKTPDKELTAFLREPDVQAHRLPDSRVAWERFAWSARLEGLSGLVLHHARRRGLRMPDAIESRLKREADTIRVANVNRIGELERVVSALNEADIPAMLLKGAALDATVYGRSGLRSMSDLDVLVRPGDARHAVRCLTLGICRLGAPLIRDDFFPNYYYELELLTQSIHPARLDLHAHPFRPLRLSRTIPTDAFWDGAMPVSVGSAVGLVPRSETMFIHLAAHAAFHGCDRLSWLYDIDQWVRAYGPVMDWSFVAETVRAWGLAGAVERAVEATECCFGASCPDGFCDAIRSIPVHWADRMVLAHTPHEAKSPVRHVAVTLLCTPGIGVRCGYLFPFIFPGRSHLAESYPYRHIGWVYSAWAWRIVGLVGRVLAVPAAVCARAWRGVGVPAVAALRRCARGVAGRVGRRRMPGVSGGAEAWPLRRPDGQRNGSEKVDALGSEGPLAHARGSEGHGRGYVLLAWFGLFKAHSR